MFPVFFFGLVDTLDFSDSISTVLVERYMLGAFPLQAVWSGVHVLYEENLG